MTKSRKQQQKEDLEEQGAFQDESLDDVPTESVAPDDDADRPIEDALDEAVSTEELGIDVEEDGPVNGVDEGVDVVEARAVPIDEADVSSEQVDEQVERQKRGPDLPTFDPNSVDTNFFVSRPELPSQPPLQNQSKIAAPEASAAPDVARAGVDYRFATPDVHNKPSAEPASVGGDAWGARAQENLIAEQVRKALEKLGLNEENIRGALVGGTVAVPDPIGGQQFSNAANLPSFKYHFRCDVSPELKVQMLDMSAIDRGERPQDYPLAGRWITFRLGHLQTNDENVARQIKWMMERPSISGDGQTIGGNPSIYEDDGSVIFKCPDCDFVTASANGYKAHRRATHGA